VPIARLPSPTTSAISASPMVALNVLLIIANYITNVNSTYLKTVKNIAREYSAYEGMPSLFLDV